jgi:ABC-type bacteriocin/lantibiotic exporter with double-glycine peptidase domain
MQVVQDALDAAQVGRTSITIAHRLSTIKGADKIYVIEVRLYSCSCHDDDNDKLKSDDESDE